MLKKERLMVLKSSCIRLSVMAAAVIVMMVSVAGVAPAQTADVQKKDVKKIAAALVDINRASEKELEGLKSIGSATAKKIVAHRPYKTVDELSRAGLKPKTIEAIKPFVTVGSTQAAKMPGVARLAPGTRININTADQATLEKLPDIGPVKAKAIIAGRPYSKIEDIMKVSGIKGKTFEAVKDYIVVR